MDKPQEISCFHFLSTTTLGIGTDAGVLPQALTCVERAHFIDRALSSDSTHLEPLRLHAVTWCDLVGSWFQVILVVTLNFCVCVFMCSGVYASVWGQRSQQFVSFLITLHLVFEISFLIGYRVHKLARLAGHRIPGVLLSLPPNAVSIGVCHHAWMFM